MCMPVANTSQMKPGALSTASMSDFIFPKSARVRVRKRIRRSAVGISERELKKSDDIGPGKLCVGGNRRTAAPTDQFLEVLCLDLTGTGSLHPDVARSKLLPFADLANGDDTRVREVDGRLLFGQNALVTAERLKDRPRPLDEVLQLGWIERDGDVGSRPVLARGKVLLENTRAERNGGKAGVAT